MEGGSSCRHCVACMCCEAESGESGGGGVSLERVLNAGPRRLLAAACVCGWMGTEGG